jgi:hypothetical protein
MPYVEDNEASTFQTTGGLHPVWMTPT